MSTAEKIRDTILEFPWHNYGFDEVEDVEPEWAQALAEGIAAALGGPDHMSWERQRAQRLLRVEAVAQANARLGSRNGSYSASAVTELLDAAQRIAEFLDADEAGTK